MEMGISHYYTCFEIISMYAITLHVQIVYNTVKILIVTLLRSGKHLQLMS